MKVLFVSSGNAIDGISPIVRNQGQSLIDQGIKVDFFTIKGKGVWAYIRHIYILRKYLNSNYFDIVHSHYSYSSFVATFAGAKPLIVSLMGSDIRANRVSRLMIRFLHNFSWDQTIVKSTEMFHYLNFKKAKIIPNGVNICRLKPINKEDCQKSLGWDSKKKNILFASDPNRIEKNFHLAKISIDSLIYKYDVSLHFLKNISHKEIPIFMNAADVIILSSLYEGSPNVIKEAMACNCPIVTTRVGDVNWVLGDTIGCFSTSYDPVDVAEKIKLALEFREKIGYTKGRERIIELGLDSVTIAERLIEIYKKVF